jgi:hypothetical protein
MFRVMANAVIRSIWLAVLRPLDSLPLGKEEIELRRQNLRFITAVIVDQQTNEGGSDFHFPRVTPRS